MFWGVAFAAILVAGFAGTIPEVAYIGESHYEFGLTQGRSMASVIKRRFAASPDLANLTAWYHLNGSKAIFDSFVKVQRMSYPEYFDELRGIADGSGQSLLDVLLLNLDEELSYFATNNSMPHAAPPVRRRKGVDHCSDYLVHTSGSVSLLDGHNEDGGASDINNTYIIHANFTHTGLTFSAYVYAGELPSGAFGVNNHGVGFTLNYVEPAKAVWPGIARNFVSRSLLDSVSFADGVRRATVKNLASGHNTQLMSFGERRVADIETGGDSSLVTELLAGQTPLFHANIYMHLNIPQIGDENSDHRIARAKQLPLPTDAASVFRVLGDTTDPLAPPKYTIYQQGPDLYTLATALFDLNACTVHVYTGNPLTSPTLQTVWRVAPCAGLQQ